MSERVARRRGLALRDRPSVERVSRSVLVERAVGLLNAGSPTPSQRAEAALLGALELVPPGFSWPEAQRALFAERLDALYDPRARRILVDRALPPQERTRAIAHELVHALADQHHALGARLLDERATTADARALLLALAEGEAAALVEQLWGSEPFADRLPQALSARAGAAATPAILVSGLAATYADGLALVRRALAVGGWAAVDALYRDPPGDSRALLGVAAPGAARRLAPPPAPGPHHRLVFSDVLGAQRWRLVLEQWQGAQTARQLARAWRGDRLSVFEDGAMRALCWEIAADLPSTRRAAQAVSAGLALAASTDLAGLACRAHRDSGVVGAWRGRGRLVLAALVPAAAADPERASCAALARWLGALPDALAASAEP